MANRFARPTLDTLARYRTERDAFLAQARANYDAFGDARRTLELVRQAQDTQRRVLWAEMAKVPRAQARGMPSEGRRTLGWAATAP